MNKAYADMVGVASSSKNPALASLIENVMVDVLKQAQSEGVTDQEELRKRMLQARAAAKAAFQKARDMASAG